MEKLEEFILVTNLRFQQLQDQIDTQTMVIAWLLSNLDETEHFHPSKNRDFLIGQSAELTGEKHEESVAIFAALLDDSDHYTSLRHNLG